MASLDGVIPAIVGAAGSGAAVGYEIERSLRFNSADSAYLNFTPSSAGNRKTWTWSGWVKRVKFGAYDHVFGHYDTDFNPQHLIRFMDSDRLEYIDYTGSYQARRVTTAKYRDPSAWMHIVVAWDTTQATADDRVKVYVNGDQITAFDEKVNPSQNHDGSAINTTVAHGIGKATPGSGYLNGYLADVHFIDGQALAASDFGEYDDNNVWQPKAYSGTYGTNGFHLDFSDNSSNAALGYDAAGSNDWTVNNLSVSDGTVATANGALPILNTTGDYGETVGTGTRTDSNSSNIVLALPMNGTNGGTTFTDQHATIKGSGSAKTVTVSNVTTSTAQSFFYGSSALFNSTSDKLTVPTGGSGGDIDFEGGSFTIECWCYANSINPSSAHLVSCWVDPSPLSFQLSMGGGGSQNKFTFGAAGGNAIDGTARSAGQWYHVAAVRDSNTLRLFVNGEQAATAACSGDVTDPPADVTIGQMSNNSSANWDGYISDLRIYKGVAKYTSNFNPPSRTGGSNCDSLIDTPTDYEADSGNNGGNYATLNPLDNGGQTLSNGNLDIEGVSAWRTTRGTIGLSSGKWYWEFLHNFSRATSTRECMVGIAKANATLTSYTGSDANGWGYYDIAGNIYHNGSGGSTIASYDNGDIIGVAFDADNGKLYFSKNGTFINSGDPVAGTGAVVTGLTSGPYFPAFAFFGTGTKSPVNFGQRPFAYTPPTGYKSLCTTNLPDPTIADGSTAFDAVAYSGNGGTQSITGVNFSPDFLWFKRRQSPTRFHLLYDTVRGASGNKVLSSNSTNAEGWDTATYGQLDSADSNGFTVTTGSNTDDNINSNNDTYIAWLWDGGTSTVSNTDGSITSSVRANASAGFSIIKATVSGSGTIGHGLNAKPHMVFRKRTNGTSDWYVAVDTGSVEGYLLLNSTAAITSESQGLTSSVFTAAWLGNSGEEWINYAFAPVEGYSAFGSYTGNGSTDGPFVYTGFRPRWVMIKWTTGSNAWIIVDTARDPFNPEKQNLNANDSNAENTSAAGSWFDGLSNGFKITGVTDNVINSSGGTYIYAAFAEHPFKTARAR